ncbi:MAG: hypothetical protein A2Z27_02760 [candidate division Zixibacteria bacterium RBG_16_50_21]|nr:MAG: hypothetical protein A2Z27_02760 [candidate division Zixibacteria bacterium RBG_16_50_21]
MTGGALQRLISRLTDLRAYHTRFQVILGFLFTAGIAIAGLLFASLISSIWTLPAFLRVGLLGIFLLALSAALAYFAIRPLLYRSSLENLALRVEEHFPQLSDRLISALQLQKQYVSNPEGYSLEMIDAVVYQAEKLSADLDFKSVVDKKNLRKLGRVIGSLAVVLLAFALVFPGNFKFALYAFSNPLTELEEPAKFLFEITPGNKEVVKYSDIEIGVKLSPAPAFQNIELPRRLKLFYKFENSDWESVNLKKTDRSKLSVAEQKDYDFSHTFKEVKRNFEFYAWAEGEKSEVYSIKVVDKPRVTDLKVSLSFPGYTGLKAQVLNDNEGNIKALLGTKAKVQVKSNKLLENAQIVFSDGTFKALSVDKRLASGEFRISQDITYHVEVLDDNGNTNPDPIEYQITVVPDESPQVEIVYPGEDRDLDEAMRMPLRVAVQDDYGVNSLKIKYKINSGGRESPEAEIALPVQKNSSEFVSEYDWSLAKFPIMPGDYIIYKAEVWDNDAITGPKKSESRSYNLRLPTLDEIIAEVEQEQSGQISKLEDVFFGTEELKRKIENLTSNLETQEGQSWEKSKEFEAALQQQEEIFKAVEDVKNQLERTLDKMVRNELVRQEVAQKMQEIKKLMDQIRTPEMEELIKKIQEALKKLDWDKIKESMKDFKLSQEDLLKRLDQTLALLKKIQAEQKLDTMAKMLEKMAEKQEQINEQLEKMAEKDLSQLAEQEKTLNRDLENVSDEMKEFKQMMEEMPLLSEQDQQEMESALNQQENQQEIQSMSQQLGMCNKQNSQKSGQKLSSSFQNAAQKFSQMAQKLSQSQERELLAKMQKTLQDVLYLSEQQENLSNQVKAKQNDSDQLRDLAGEQTSLKESAQKVNNSLEEMLKESNSIPRQLSQRLGMCANQMAQAASQLSNKNSLNALSLQTDAMANLNQIARDLLEDVNKQCNNSSAGMCSNPSLSQGLQGLSRQQQGVNQKTDELSNMLQDMMLPGQEQMQRLAQEQAGVQKGLEELIEESFESANTLGRLDKLAEDIKEAVKKLERGEVDQDLKQRQNRILNWLLDANKSLYTQDYSNQRQAEVGEDVLRKSPSSLNLNAEKARSAGQQKIEREKYPPQYEEMIESYFKAIRERDLK